MRTYRSPRIFPHLLPILFVWGAIGAGPGLNRPEPAANGRRQVANGWLTPWAAREPVRRAVLVGINRYAVAGTPASQNALSTRGLGNLEGPVNDVEAMGALLVSRFSFRPENILVLTDDQATREGILGAIRDHLGASRSGDQAFFFYAGHGSWVENSRSPEADKRDETIVPVDAARGVADIRDKELRAPFAALLDRGVDVTLVFDACHSGSITRGVDPGLERSVRAAPGDVADAAAYPAPPADHRSGRALVFSAARDDQKAREFVNEDGVSAGAFTWAFVEALRSTPAGVPAAFLFQQVRARMKARGFEQDPVFEGGEARRREPLFAASADARYSGVVVPVLSVTAGKEIVVQAGLAIGLRAGAELVVVDRPASGSPARVRITEILGLARAKGTLVSGAAEGLTEGTLLTVDRWATQTSGPLRLWLPPAAPDMDDAEAVYLAASLLRSAPNVRWVDDPTADAPTHVLSWDGTAWGLDGPGRTRSRLGGEPSTGDLRAALAGQAVVHLFVSIPPSIELRAETAREISRGGTGVVTQDQSAGTSYRLVGTMVRGERRFYWLNTRAASGESAGGLPPTTEPAAGLDRTVARTLAGQATKLGRSWGWLGLEPPSASVGFPYRIAGFERADVRRADDLSDTLDWGGRYRVLLEAPGATLGAAARSAVDGGTARWHWYLFAMDRQGTGTLLYPRAANQPNQVNLLARDAESRTRIAVPDASNWLFSPSASVAGASTDMATLFLLASAEVLPDPSAVLNFSGVGSRAEIDTSVVSAGSLSALLFEMGSGTRSAGMMAPVRWDLQRVPIVSAPARTGR